MYADKEYYDTYYRTASSSVPDGDVETYLRRASLFMDSLFLHGAPAEPYAECVKATCCEIADCFYETESRSGIASENNDGYSVAFTHSGESDEAGGKALGIAKRLLANTGLLYRGVV